MRCSDVYRNVRVGFVTLIQKATPDHNKLKHDKRRSNRGSDHKFGEIIYELSGADEKLRDMRRWNGELYTIIRCPHCRRKIRIREGGRI